MPKYRVEYIIKHDVEVTAANEQEADEKAMGLLGSSEKWETLITCIDDCPEEE
jgi:hypothetical protein